MANRRAQFSATIIDANGASTATHVNMSVDDSTTLLSLLNSLDNFATAVDNASDGMVTEVRMSYPLTPSNVKAAPVANIDLSQSFTLSMDNGTPFSTPFVIPAVKNAAIVNGNPDPANASIAAMVTWLTVVHAGAQAVSEGFNALLSLKSVLLSFPERRRRTSRRVVVP